MVKRCIIVDIDGTLADARHRQHHLDKEPKDWDSFFAAAPGDQVIQHVAEICRVFDYDGCPVVLCTGRPAQHRDLTVDWLVKCDVPYSWLLTRGMDDRREDHIVKKEMLDAIRAQGYEPLFAIDDRPSVVQMWRDNGVPCLAMDDVEWRKRGEGQHSGWTEHVK